MPTALLSTSNKEGLVEFARSLSAAGWTLLATGGTAAALTSAAIPVKEIAEYTKSPEILDGRVKTLHPAVFGGILSRRTDEDAQDLQKINAAPIDMVIVNLYPFDETIRKPDTTYQDAIENIDIGGVTLIRAAAKNHAYITVATDPGDYAEILSEILKYGNTDEETRQRLAVKAFQHTMAYDRSISGYLAAKTGSIEDTIEPAWFSSLPYTSLRYGENPHQSARLYYTADPSSPMGGQLLQGKELSYNNLLDLDAAWRSVVAFDTPSVCIVKHNSPCGIARCQTQVESFTQALACDPVSAYGGIIATNVEMDSETAQAIKKLFVECIISPGFSAEALEILSKKKNCRVIRMPQASLSGKYEFRSIEQGILWQERDLGDPAGNIDDWKIVTKRKPDSNELSSLKFAWKACQHVKSNAIVLAKGEATVGIGGGQPNRVDCIKIAAERASHNAHQSVMASDAFFPFGDSIVEAAKIGVTAIIQPGGSIRDDESIQAADEHNIAMIFTGVRHFRH